LQPNSTNLNSYLIDTNSDVITNTISEYFAFTKAFNITSPIGIDYHSPSNALIVSEYYGSAGEPNNFAAIYTNLIMSNSIVVTNVVITNWSRVAGLSDEVKLATVKTNASGFTNGDLYYGAGNAIGWLSADGTRSNLNWCVLTNAAVTNALPIRGSLYVDQTGLFSNNLIAVTSDAGNSSPPKGVWRVDSLGYPTLITNIPTLHLEGVVTLPNDTNQWGPWDGKIVTGDEDFNPGGRIFAIATNGNYLVFNATNLIAGGIRSEDMDLIQSNQDFFVCNNAASGVYRLSANYFRNYTGDLLISDAGEQEIPHQGCFFIVRWDNIHTNFAITKFGFLDQSLNIGEVEHATFAPITTPNN
jgi:hypothetical protein